MYFLFGVVLALLTLMNIQWTSYGWAAYCALLSLYWFQLAALESFADKFLDKIMVQTFPMPSFDAPKDDEDNA